MKKQEKKKKLPAEDPALVRDSANELVNKFLKEAKEKAIELGLEQENAQWMFVARVVNSQFARMFKVNVKID